MKIVLIDDEELIMDLIESLLSFSELENYTIEKFSDYKKFKEDPPNDIGLVIADVSVLRGDFDYLYDLYDKNDFKLYFLTGNEEFSSQRGQVIYKPFDMSELINIIVKNAVDK